MFTTRTSKYRDKHTLLLIVWANCIFRNAQVRRVLLVATLCLTAVLIIISIERVFGNTRGNALVLLRVSNKAGLMRFSDARCTTSVQLFYLNLFENRPMIERWQKVVVRSYVKRTDLTVRTHNLQTNRVNSSTFKCKRCITLRVIRNPRFYCSVWNTFWRMRRITFFQNLPSIISVPIYFHKRSTISVYLSRYEWISDVTRHAIRFVAELIPRDGSYQTKMRFALLKTSSFRNTCFVVTADWTEIDV